VTCDVHERIGVWWGDLKERDKLVDLNVDGKIIFDWILKQYYMRVGLQEVLACGGKR